MLIMKSVRTFLVSYQRRMKVCRCLRSDFASFLAADQNGAAWQSSRKFCVKKESSSSETESKADEVKSLLENSASYSELNRPNDWASPIYPVLSGMDLSAQSPRPKVDPRTTSILLFPGQGSQYVGMSKSLIAYPNVREMYDIASEILRFDLLSLCLNGPKDMLDMTAHCQAAVMVSSLAAVEKLKSECETAIENCVAAAGFSVGEYTALVFAGALTFEDAVRLLKIRGEAMQKASEAVKSGMMTVFLRPGVKTKSICAAAKDYCTRLKIDSPECCVATYLFADCKVIAGNIEALKFLQNNAADFGIKKMKYIPVSGAFHSKLMNPARSPLASALHSVEIQTPLIPVYSNVDSKYYTNPKDIRKKLSLQVCSPVRWQQIMNVLFKRSDGTLFPNVYECGPGKTMRTILKMINAKACEHFENIIA